MGKTTIEELFKNYDGDYVSKELDWGDTSDVEAPPLVRNGNGELLCPGHPKMCLHSGDFELFECACDECDHFLECYPEHQGELEEALKQLRERTKAQ